MHKLALITWHLKTHSQKMFPTIVLQENISGLGDIWVCILEPKMGTQF